MKRITWFVLVCLLLLSVNSQAADEALPAEVNALIGMKLPPKVEGEKQADIPRFVRGLFGIMLNRQIGEGASKAELVFQDGIVDGKWPVIIVSAVYHDRTVMICDAKLLPADLINWRYTNRKIEWVRSRYEFSPYCHSTIEDGRTIFGLVKSVNDTESESNNVVRAWEINQQTGKIVSIPTKDISCGIMGE